MTDRQSVVMLGLPQTGKSAYLGTLWHCVEEPSVTEVREADLPGDLDHVQALAAALRALEKIPRTHREDEYDFDAPVAFADGKTARLRVPDLSGEHLRDIVEQRVLTERLQTELDNASGVIFFLHPAEIEPPIGIGVANVVSEPAPAAAAGGEPMSALPEDVAPEDEFENKRACTAALVIDCLENILEAMSGRWPVRVAVVASAFDLTKDVTPDEWLEQRLPAVRSFLKSNSDRVAWTIFGVSAQGGARNDRHALLDKDLHDRAYVLSSEGDKLDFSAPIRWALAWE